MKTTWHTDIVVDGQGFGLLVRKWGAAWIVEADPDQPGTKGSARAWKKFMKALVTHWGLTKEEVMRNVERAVRATRASWNKWHKHAY